MSRKDRPELTHAANSFSTMRDYYPGVGQSCNSFTMPSRRSSLTGPAIRERTGRTQRSNSVSSAGNVELVSSINWRVELAKKRPSLVTKIKEGKDDNNDTTEKYSMVVLGVGGVGKTALVVRFVTGRFLNEYDPTLVDYGIQSVCVACLQAVIRLLSEETPSIEVAAQVSITLGQYGGHFDGGCFFAQQTDHRLQAEMTYEKELRIGESAVSLGILDTAGNGEASYIKHGDGFVVVYSITDYYSFEVARQLIKLIKEVRKTRDICQVPIVLVGNKRDLRRGRSVSKEEAREVASEYGCSHYETSALTNRNVQVIFYNMVFQTRFTKASNKESRKSSQHGQGNGFLNTVKHFFNPGSRRASLPS